MTIYVPKNSLELRDQMLRDAYLAAITRDPNSAPPVEPDGDWGLIFGAVANSMMLAFSNIQFHERQSDPQNAEEPRLDDHRRAAGLPEEVEAPSTGRLVLKTNGGAANVPSGMTGKLPNGKLVYVDGFASAVPDGGTVAVFTDNGADTEFKAGTIVEWISPPGNIAATATVSEESPLTGGQDTETAERKRARIANRRRFPITAGSPGQLRDDAFKSLATVQQVFVYCAPGGPSTEKIVVTKGFSPDVFDFSRALTDTALARVRQYIHARYPGGEQHVIATSADVPTDVAITATLPASAEAGGNGNGWVDAAPWPPLAGSDTRVTVTGTSDPSVVVMSASTSTAPVSGQTHIAWFSPSDRQFHVRRVISVSGSAGTWSVKVDSPLIDGTQTAVAIGDYISPATVNSSAYAASWVAQMEKLGVGELTADANRLPRSTRLPYQYEIPSNLDNSQLLAMNSNHPEMVSPAYTFRFPTSPTTPALVSDNPNVLTPRHFGLYAA